MKTLKIGIVLLTVWCGLEIAVAGWVIAMTFAGRLPPALVLVMPEARLSNIDPVVLAVINAQPLQVSAFGSDSFLGHRNLLANLISTLVLTVSLVLCGAGCRGMAGGRDARDSR